MENYSVHLTFKTDKITSEILKLIAHKYQMTQPELINEICKDFINEYKIAHCTKEGYPG